MAALAALWPLVQSIRFGKVYLDDAFGTEVANRLAPTEESSPLGRLFELTGWLMQDSAVMMCFGVGALLLLPLAGGARRNPLDPIPRPHPSRRTGPPLLLPARHAARRSPGLVEPNLALGTVVFDLPGSRGV